ncbi:MAG: phenylalanine--tRNA ligase beta subunit-related protein [archaeon]
MEISIDESLRLLYPDLNVGVVVIRDVVNKDFDPALESRKREAESFIRGNLVDFSSLPRVKSYNKFYKRYEKKFPIEFQLKSVISGKQIPTVSVLVESMFLSELLNQVLVAGHDLECLEGGLVVGLARGGEEYVKINNETQIIKKDDIILNDANGVVASVLYGPDFRTRVTRHTVNVAYIAYFLYDFSDEDIRKAMQDIADNVLISNPEAKVSLVRIVKFDGL